MSSFSDPQKIRARVQRYKRNFRKHDYRDGSGSRYLLGVLYLLLDDTAGALDHYKWFAKTFPDDGGEPFHQLCWALALYRAGMVEQAAHRLRRAYAENVFLIPAILGVPHGQSSGLRRGSNWQEAEYVAQAPHEFLTLWRVDEKIWLRSVWDSHAFKDFVRAHMNLEQQLFLEQRGEKRTALVKAFYALAEEKA